MKVKSRLPDERKKGVVYQIPCNDCDHVYTEIKIRENSKSMYDGAQKAVKMNDPNNGIADHVAKSQHSIDWPGEQLKGTGKGEQWKLLKSGEAGGP